MYNRYIPQPDGSYQKNRVEKPRPYPQTPQNAPQKPIPVSQQNGKAEDFLKQLLPKNLQTGDLLILVLLLLMAGDSPEDKNTALLTLALYLFL